MRQAITSVITALAVLAAAASLRYLFVDSSFMRPAALVVIVVVGLGVALRTRTRAVTVLLPVQALGLALALAWLFARDTLWFALPTTRTVERAVELVLQSQDTITSYAAPAPVDAGVTFAHGHRRSRGPHGRPRRGDGRVADHRGPAGAGALRDQRRERPDQPAVARLRRPAALWLLVLAHQDGDQLRRWVSHVPGTRARTARSGPAGTSRPRAPAWPPSASRSRSPCRRSCPTSRARTSATVCATARASPRAVAPG
ncbi:hypothetical protein [Janibacter melonis]|uniref:hypothetical protein n=1 Tax=Janibacter melonis TaxID=262209 RepID=UPI0020953C96|nr:hypothetical protein [Janibacter melonis]